MAAKNPKKIEFLVYYIVIDTWLFEYAGQKYGTNAKYQNSKKKNKTIDNARRPINHYSLS